MTKKLLVRCNMTECHSYVTWLIGVWNVLFKCDVANAYVSWLRPPFMCDTTHSCVRPTQSVMYVPLQVNRFHESILLIVQYKYLKSWSEDFYCPESHPPHKIMSYWVYYSIWWGFSFPPDYASLVEMFCTTVVPVSKGHLGGVSP